jgi:hypothetical protein
VSPPIAPYSRLIGCELETQNCGRKLTLSGAATAPIPSWSLVKWPQNRIVGGAPAAVIGQSSQREEMTPRPAVVRRHS